MPFNSLDEANAYEIETKQKILESTQKIAELTQQLDSQKTVIEEKDNSIKNKDEIIHNLKLKNYDLLEQVSYKSENKKENQKSQEPLMTYNEFINKLL